MHKTTHNKGFALLLAIVIAGLVLTIGLTLSFIASREFSLSGTNRDSQLAYYAAQSGAGCAESNAGTGIFNGTKKGDTFSISCNGKSNDTAVTVTADGVSTFTFTLNPQHYQAIVTVTEVANDQVSIDAKGYNSDNPNNIRRVERGITKVAAGGCFTGGVLGAVHQDVLNQDTPYLRTVLRDETHNSSYVDDPSYINQAANQKNYTFWNTKSFTPKVELQIKPLACGSSLTDTFGYYLGSDLKDGLQDSDLHDVEQIIGDPNPSNCHIIGPADGRFLVDSGDTIYFYIKVSGGAFWSTDLSKNSLAGTPMDTNINHLLTFHDEASDRYFMGVEDLGFYPPWDPTHLHSDQDFNDIVAEISVSGSCKINP
jgi:Tfp pilus assembly protein PilX